jgi:hypothetical protein
MGNLISQLLLCKTITPDFNLEELASINKDSEEIKGLLADMQDYMPQQQDSTSQGKPIHRAPHKHSLHPHSLPCGGAGANIRKYAHPRNRFSLRQAGARSLPRLAPSQLIPDCNIAGLPFPSLKYFILAGPVCTQFSTSSVHFFRRQSFFLLF